MANKTPRYNQLPLETFKSDSNVRYDILRDIYCEKTSIKANNNNPYIV